MQVKNCGSWRSGKKSPEITRTCSMKFVIAFSRIRLMNGGKSWGMVLRFASVHFLKCIQCTWIRFKVSSLESFQFNQLWWNFIENMSVARQHFVRAEADHLKYFTFLYFIRLNGLGVWFSLWVREVPGSNPGWALFKILNNYFNRWNVLTIFLLQVTTLLVDLGVTRFFRIVSEGFPCF